jgi:hypothetical protein
MDQFAFTFSMQAQLAADLVGDPDFTGSDIQINNMKMGKCYICFHTFFCSHIIQLTWRVLFRPWAA